MKTIEEMFPELKESEDERIRRVIRGWIYTRPASFFDNGISKEEMLAWLEKQGNKDKLIKELGEYKAKYTQEVLEKHVNSMSNKDDERLRKTTIAFLKEYADKGYENAVECIDWLENQGESSCQIHYWTEEEIEPIISDYLRGAEHYGGMIGRLRCLKPKSFEKQTAEQSPFTFDDVLALQCAMARAKESDEKLYEALRSLHDRIHDIYHGEQQGNEEPTDKPEPNFHNGQWIVWQDKCYKVNDNGCGYELVDQDGLSTSLEYGTIDENAHLWDITKDAKDGDVLSDGTTILSDGSVKSYCDYDTNSGESDAFCPLSMNLMCSKITPATKEQRDTLFAKMKDAGWEFDFDKKELKKIEQEPAETLVDWCVEDEKMLKVAIESCNKCGNGYAYPWLKSLKDRVQPQSTWKPSQKQMEALNEAIYHVDDVVATPLAKLIGDLKKLKE